VTTDVRRALQENATSLHLYGDEMRSIEHRDALMQSMRRCDSGGSSKKLGE
jgi:hypothetical protein